MTCGKRLWVFITAGSSSRGAKYSPETCWKCRLWSWVGESVTICKFCLALFLCSPVETAAESPVTCLGGCCGNSAWVCSTLTKEVLTHRGQASPTLLELDFSVPKPISSLLVLKITYLIELNLFSFFLLLVIISEVKSFSKTSVRTS